MADPSTHPLDALHEDLDKLEQRNAALKKGHRKHKDMSDKAKPLAIKARALVDDADAQAAQAYFESL